MMMGYGGSSPSSSSSNLSALAPPFTVDRSIPKPVVDLTDTSYGLTYNHSSHNWLGPQPNPSPDYFSSKTTEFELAAPSSNTYRYSSTDTPLYPQKSNNLLEVKSYYPSYYTKATGSSSTTDIPHNSGYDLLSSSQVYTRNLSVHGDSSSHWSGLWEGLTDWQQSRPAQFDESFYSKENNFNKGLYSSEGMINFEETCHNIDAEKKIESGFRGLRDHESFLGEIPKFVPSVSPISSSSVSSLQVPETCPPVNSWGHQMLYGASYEKCLSQHNATPSDIPSNINSFPANIIGSPEQDTSLFRNNEQFISGLSLGKNKEVSRNETAPLDTLDQLCGKKSRILVPPASPDSSSIIGDESEGVKYFSENIDQHNPAVDSPCWRGAPVSHFSLFEDSKACIPLSNNKFEGLSGSNAQAHPISYLSGNDAENISPQKTTQNLTRQESWSRGSCFAPQLKTTAVNNMVLGEGIAGDSLCKNELFDSVCKILHNEKESFEARIGVKNVGMNVNDDFDEFSSQVPFHAIENVLCSPHSTGDAPSKFIESNGGESSQKMYVRKLIDTMQHLSKLLVFHLSSHACELKKDEYEALKDVIHNLELCMDKTAERSGKDYTSQVNGSSSNHDKDRQASGIHPRNIQAPVKYQLVEEEGLSSVSDKSDDKLSNFVSAGEQLKDDIMIQALKKTLVKNFDADEGTDLQVLLYKNLWLEAEASLCSASCISRFNRVKNEMENYNSQITNGKSVVMEKLPRSEVPFNRDAANTFSSGATKPRSSILSGSSSHEDDVAARFNILKCRIDNSNTENTSYEHLLGYAEKLPTLEGSVKNSGFEEKAAVQKSEMSRNANDFEDSVMSRFHVLKCRDSNLTEEQKLSETQNTESGLKSNLTEHKVEIKEFHHIVDEDPMSKSRMVRKGGNLGDGSSEWEHVLLEELTGLGS